VQSVSTLNSVVSTNASQWEPGEFNNGVDTFGPGNKVFILHDTGPEGGANQRYLFIVLTAQQTLVLTKLQVNVRSNAFGSGPNNPVTVAVEASSTNNFASVVNLGSVSTVFYP
jgi:hypothetical protein